MKPFDPATKGKQVASIDELFALADAKRSVVIPRHTGRPQPAAFIQNYGARHLHSLIVQGAIFVYEKQTKETQAQ